MSSEGGHRLDSHALVDCTDAFDLFGRRDRTSAEIRIRVTEHTYLPAGETREGWFPNIARGLLRLAERSAQEGRPLQSYASVGIGPGLDAIAAVEALGVRRLALMDLHQDVVDSAKENVLRNCPSIKPDDVCAFVSDLCTEMRRRDLRSDVLYENLPNIPADDVDLSAGVTAASFFRRAPSLTIPNVYARHRLALHYRFLTQARECLTDTGVVVCCIGGRVPLRIVEEMFVETGYSPDVLNFEMVRQFEAAGVVGGFAQAERQERLMFRFYPYREGRAALEEIRSRNGHSIASVMEDAALQRLSISAVEAEARLAAGEDIGHLGVVWRGRPNG